MDRTESSGRISFLSSNTQDFIEVVVDAYRLEHGGIFLSSNTQDFIEVLGYTDPTPSDDDIPEL